MVASLVGRSLSVTFKEAIYLLLAGLGVVVTWSYNLKFFAQHPDPGLMTFFQSGYANAASASLTNDVVVLFVVFCLWIYFDAPHHGLKHLWLYPLLAFFIALAFAFPLFLFMRERHMRLNEMAKQASPKES